MLSDCQNLNRLLWSPRKIMVKFLRQRSGLASFCACAESCVVFNTGPYTDLPDNSILITANMQSETGFPCSHQLSPTLPLSPAWNWRHTVLSADASLLVYFKLALKIPAHNSVTTLPCRIFVCFLTGNGHWPSSRYKSRANLLVTLEEIQKL